MSDSVAGQLVHPATELICPRRVVDGGGEARTHDARDRAGLLAPYDNWAHRVAIDRFVQDIPARPAIRRGKLSRASNTPWRLCRTRPCQLIWGMQDWCFRPACLERLLQIFPAAEVHRLADASHYVVEDAHEQIVPRMDRFLASLSSFDEAANGATPPTTA